MPLENDRIGYRPALSRIAAPLLLALAFLWCVYWFIHAWHYWEDDAYIHLEFARSVAAGHGFSFNGRVVAGDTAPLWVFLLDGVHLLIPDWMVAGKVLAALGAAFGLAGIYAFARSLLPLSLRSEPGVAISPAAMLLLIVVNPYFCYWAFSGMESIAAAGLACWAVLVAIREPPAVGTFLTGCLLAGIAPLVRPEMMFLTLLLAIPLFATWRHLPPSPAKFAVLAAGLVLIAAPQTAWSLYSLHAFGHLLPNTNAAKRAAPDASVLYRLVIVYGWAFPVILCGLLTGLVFLVLRPNAVGDSLRSALVSAWDRSNSARTGPPGNTAASHRALSLAAWFFILWSIITSVFYVANHTYVQTRYILIVAPGLTVVVLLLIFLLSPRAGRFLYVAVLVSATAVSVIVVRPFIRSKGIDCDLIRDMALYMRNQLPPHAPVAVYSIGEIAFVSQHPIVDTGGITRPGAIPYLNDPSLERMVRWAVSQGAQYYIEARQPEPGAVPVYTIDMRHVGWFIEPSRYSQSVPVSLWKLPASAPASSAAAQRTPRPLLTPRL